MGLAGWKAQGPIQMEKRESPFVANVLSFDQRLLCAFGGGSLPTFTFN
jgi:hypothetical protein